MNKVSSRCEKDSCAKFLYASNKMFFELKLIKILLYLLNIIPVVICFLPQSTEEIQLICSIVSFALTLVNEVVVAFLANYKEKAILSHQLYEASITGKTFSKIEYDRETSNELNESAIRKGLPKMRKKESYPISNVPQDITDDYSYLYLCRTSVAKTKYLLSRVFRIYAALIILITIAFIAATFMDYTTGKTLYLLVCIWPLIMPFIKNLTASKRCIRQCAKICADIDNYFADGDTSVERLARFNYYVQNVEFEMLTVRPVMYIWLTFPFRKGINILNDGVTERFRESLVELKGKALMNKGIIAQPKGKALITKVDYDLDSLTKIVKVKKKGTETKKSSTATKKNQSIASTTSTPKTTSTKK